MSGILTEIITVGGILLLGSISIFSLICGLLKASELVEEYPFRVKKVLKYAGFVIIILHILLYLFESYPFIPSIIGMISQLVYLLNQTHFPVTKLSSFPFIGLLSFSLVNHFVWFFYYLTKPHPYSFNFNTAAFFALLIWAIPLAYFCALTTPDSMLPSNDGPRRSSLLKGLFKGWLDIPTRDDKRN